MKVVGFYRCSQVIPLNLVYHLCGDFPMRKFVGFLYSDVDVFWEYADGGEEWVVGFEFIHRARMRCLLRGGVGLSCGECRAVERAWSVLGGWDGGL